MKALHVDQHAPDLALEPKLACIVVLTWLAFGHCALLLELEVLLAPLVHEELFLPIRNQYVLSRITIYKKSILLQETFLVVINEVITMTRKSIYVSCTSFLMQLV